MTDKLKYTLNIACALNCEAKAMVDRFKLKKVSDKPFSVFSGVALLNQSAMQMNAQIKVQINVLISGLGALNMATSVGWLAARETSGENDLYPSAEVWLNLGIAGHGGLDIGQAFVVSSSSDLLSTRTYYPPQVARRPVDISSCLSLNAPSGDYPDEGGIDMEASAFFNAASRFAAAECVQAFKVVSDNPDNGLDDLDAKRIHQLILPHVDSIEQFASALFAIQTKENSPNERQVEGLIAELLSEQRATHAQRSQFSSMAVQLGYMMTSSDFSEFCDELSTLTGIKLMLSEMQSRIESITPSLA